MLNGSYDEGLGTVYERIMLSEMFDKLIEVHRPHTILEVPIRGMTGITGINSVEFTRKGCDVTLGDTSTNIVLAQDWWRRLNLPIKTQAVSNFNGALPFQSKSFDLVWNFAALWHLEHAPLLVHEMARISNDLVLIFVQNTTQPGHLLRKYITGRRLFSTIYEKWLNISLCEEILRMNRFIIFHKGVIDIPPFPDIATPIGRKVNAGWKWNIMDYYLGKDDGLLDRLAKYRKLEDSHIPDQLKALWGHHRFILAGRRK